MSLRFKISSNAAVALRRMRELPAQVRSSIAEAMDRENDNTVRHTIRNRLSGKGPFPLSQHRLGFVTRKLGQSLRATPARVNGHVVTSTIGASVKYAAAHEFGFNGRVRVRSHNRTPGRQFQSGSRTIGVRSAQRIGALTKSGRVRKRAAIVEVDSSRLVAIRVKAHHRQANIPARAPIQHGIKDRLDAYGKRISAAIVNSYNKWKRSLRS